MSAPEPTVVRTWNRDGTTNVMGLDAAVENVTRNQSDGDGPTGERREAVRRYLAAGRTLRTPHATFELGH